MPDAHTDSMQCPVELILSHLTPSELETLGTALRARRAELLGHVRTRLHGNDATDTLAFVNRLEETGDWVHADIELDNDIALLDHELVALCEVDTALARLAAGQAGLCAACEEAIPAERLLANPTATTCLACQQSIEKKNGHAAHHSY
jgi:DnaK suppressor protein